nr:M48 family metalloprotease [Bacteroidota bacterium]
MIKPFHFQYQLCNYFKAQKKTWQWFSETKNQTEQTKHFRTELLKNTYRLEQNSDKAIYDLVDIAKQKLGIVIPVSVYQSQNSNQNNAGIIFFENEGHLILSGPIIKLLNNDELLALISHELAHILLFTIDDGDFEITNRIINSIASDYRSANAYAETARLYSLFTELFCDFNSYQVVQNSATIISTLIKIETGLDNVSPENYLKQADEIMAATEIGSTADTHPESFLRAKAISLFAADANNANMVIPELIMGKQNLYTLNIFSQSEIQATTMQILQLVLKPKWMQTEMNKNLYRQYFTDYKSDSNAIVNKELQNKIGGVSNSMKDYFAYVLLDFALCDGDISEPASAFVLDLAENLQLKKSLTKAMQKELKLSDKKLDAYCKSATTTLNKILESSHENIYDAQP